MERTISFMNGKGSIGHNTRSFIADNVDANRNKNNITLIHEDIKQVYHKLFDKALDEYNVRQKREDGQIKSYYKKLFQSKQEKLFYKVIVQIDAYIHLDEETPHLHLNFVPWVFGCKRGLETKISLKAALEEELEGAQIVLELKEERIESLEKEIENKRVSI